MQDNEMGNGKYGEKSEKERFKLYRPTFTPIDHENEGINLL